MASYLVTEGGIPHHIALDGPTVYSIEDGQALIRCMPGKGAQFHPIFPDQSFLEIVRLRQQARDMVID